MSVDAIVTVKVVPASSRDRIAGRYGDGIKICTTAAPEKGRANHAVTKILADFFAIPPDRVRLISAPSNPRKRFAISGVSQATADQMLRSLP